MTLIEVIPEEEIQKHWRKNLMAELALPFSPTSHQYCIYLLDQCNPKERKELLSKIFKRFYDVTKTCKSRVKKIKNIPQPA